MPAMAIKVAVRILERGRECIMVLNFIVEHVKNS